MQRSVRRDVYNHSLQGQVSYGGLGYIDSLTKAAVIVEFGDLKDYFYKFVSRPFKDGSDISVLCEFQGAYLAKRKNRSDRSESVFCAGGGFLGKTRAKYPQKNAAEKAGEKLVRCGLVQLVLLLRHR